VQNFPRAAVTGVPIISSGGQRSDGHIVWADPT